LVGQLFQFLARSLVHFASNHFPIMALPSNAVNEELTADVTITIESKLSRVGSLNKYFMMIVIQHCDNPNYSLIAKQSSIF
jgi:hypothetical protein